MSIAARFDSGLNFVSLLNLGGGMPTRVSVPRARLTRGSVVRWASIRQLPGVDA